MSPYSKWKIWLCLEMLIGLGNAIAINSEDIFRDMSVDERRSFFGTEDGSVPEVQLVELAPPSRQKRDIRPVIIPFKYHGVDATATLHVVQDLDLVYPTTTGLWFAETNNQAHQNVAYTPRPDIFDDIGRFHFYQNEDECSAVTKFWRTSRRDVIMMGILMQDYTVRSLPRAYGNGILYSNGSHSVVSRSTELKSDDDDDNDDDDDDNSPLYLVIFEHEKPPLEYFRLRSLGSPLGDPELHRRRRQSAGQTATPFTPPDIVYPRLLVSPDYGLVSAEKSVADFMMVLIAHLNAIDMMYRQLRDPEVRLRIAGVIIPRDSKATPYIAKDTVQTTSHDTPTVLDAITTFFAAETNRLDAATYSAILVLTQNSLYNGHKVAGTAMIGSGCAWGRAVFNYRRDFGGIMTMAHELGHVFSANHDGDKNVCSNGDGFVMASGLRYGRILKWSPCSRSYFSQFFRSRQAQCTHRRHYGVPILAHRMPGRWMSLRGQCDNRMKNATGYCLDSLVTCSRYGCDRNACYWSQDPPMEGTLLAAKSCVNQMWTDV